MGRHNARSLRSHLVKHAVLWDFGGVILSSPFEAFRRYERDRGLPDDVIRSINATNPHDNAWAQLERSDITAAEFDDVFAAEAAALGHVIPGRDVLALLAGEVRPRMVAALDRVIALGYRTACLTNNISGEHASSERSTTIAAIMSRFDAVVESSKVGVRKPELRFYEIACEQLEVRPDQCVFLDDLGINLKPAAAMGMATIKVVDPEVALSELWAVLDVAAS
jgi:putative hydrolase of the HAD superfamily